MKSHRIKISKTYNVCDDCDKPFIVRLGSNKEVLCPFCYSSFTRLVSKREYDKLYHQKIMVGNYGNN